MISVKAVMNNVNIKMKNLSRTLAIRFHSIFPSFFDSLMQSGTAKQPTNFLMKSGTALLRKCNLTTNIVQTRDSAINIITEII